MYRCHLLQVQIVLHVWVCGLEGVGLGKEQGEWLVRNGAVDSQHGTGVEESLHPCTEGHHPKLWILHLKTLHLKYCTLYSIV
jgi:hypothetical protein